MFAVKVDNEIWILKEGINGKYYKEKIYPFTGTPTSPVNWFDYKINSLPSVLQLWVVHTTGEICITNHHNRRPDIIRIVQGLESQVPICCNEGFNHDEVMDDIEIFYDSCVVKIRGDTKEIISLQEYFNLKGDISIVSYGLTGDKPDFTHDGVIHYLHRRIPIKKDSRLLYFMLKFGPKPNCTCTSSCECYYTDPFLVYEDGTVENGGDDQEQVINYYDRIRLMKDSSLVGSKTHIEGVLDFHDFLLIMLDGRICIMKGKGVIEEICRFPGSHITLPSTCYYSRKRCSITEYDS
jgi:hypothetical protein